MGLFHVGLKLDSHGHPAKAVVVPRMLVDAGSEHTWVRAETLEKAGVEPRKNLRLLGARALEGLNLRVDSRRKRLAAAGPSIAATAVPPWFGKLVQVPRKAARPRRRQAAAKRRNSPR